MKEDTFLVKFSQYTDISMSRITIEMVPLAFRSFTAPLASRIIITWWVIKRPLAATNASGFNDPLLR